MNRGDGGIDAIAPAGDAAVVHQVAIVTFPGLQPLDAVGPHEVFTGANHGAERYRCRLVAREPGRVVTESGLSLHAEALGDPTSVDTLLLAGGFGVRAACEDRELVDWIVAAAAPADQLADAHPTAEVDADPIYVRDGDLWTSAGVTAGIDLALALVEEDHGP